MALSLATLPVSYAPAMAPRANIKMSFTDEFTIESKPWSSSEVSDASGLEALAKKLNPVVGFWCAPPDTRPAACTARGTGPVVAPAAA